VPLSPDQLAEWDRGVGDIKLRAEDLSADAARAFVDTAFLATLRVDRHQVIYGRRGTGKTHLLLGLAEACRTGRTDEPALPVLLDGDGLWKAAQLLDVPPQINALSLYVESMRELARQLHETVIGKIPTPLFDQLMDSWPARRRADAKVRFERLNELLQVGEARYLPRGQASKETTRLDEVSRDGSAEAKVDVIKPNSVGLKLAASVAKKLKVSRQELTRIEGQTILPLDAVARQLTALLTVLERPRMLILFDEWSSISDLEVQPYFADLLKTTIAALPRTRLKLACVPSRTLLATPVTPERPTPIGLELGDDLFPDVDLDEYTFAPTAEGEEYRHFVPYLMSMLKKHLGVQSQWVNELTPAQFASLVVDDVFRGIEAFGELALASAGVPRDFFAILGTATTLRQKADQAQVSVPQIRQAAKLVYKSKAKSFAGNSRAHSLIDCIYQEVCAKLDPPRPHFVLSRADAEGHPQVVLLWTERVIHKLPLEWTNDGVDYVYFFLDYGRFISLIGQDAAAPVYTLAAKIAAEDSKVAIPVHFGLFSVTIDVTPLLTDAFTKGLENFLVTKALVTLPPVQFGGVDPQTLLVPAECLDVRATADEA
jgi:hypothetical protein